MGVRQMARSVLAASICLATLSQLSVAWWDNGHMLTAEIARQHMDAADVAVMDSILGDWSTDFPGMSDMVTSAVWPDLIKCVVTNSHCAKNPTDFLTIFDDWHFDDIPFNPDNLTLPPTADKWMTDPSATWVLTSAMKSFGKSNTRFAFNFLLRFMIHVIGDLHQPMHVVEGYFDDDNYGHLPNGDQGGNMIKVQGQCAPNLHLFWDAGGCNYVTSWSPSNPGKQAMTLNATKLAAKYPKDSPVFQSRYGADDLAGCWDAAQNAKKADGPCNDAFLLWAKDTGKVASRVVYSNVTNGGSLSQEYVARAQEVSQQQLVLGGYRLADALTLVAARARTLAPRSPSPAPLPGPQLSEWTSTARGLLGATIFLSIVSLSLLAFTAWTWLSYKGRLRAQQVRPTSIALVGNEV